MENAVWVNQCVIFSSPFLLLILVASIKRIRNLLFLFTGIAVLTKAEVQGWKRLEKQSSFLISAIGRKCTAAQIAEIKKYVRQAV